MSTTAVPTDAEVERLSAAVDRAFAERDRLWDIYRATGRAADEQAMLRQDAHADRLLTQYTAACQAQYAESDRRRDVNVARHGRDQAAKRGDLAEAMQGDDWLEDHGMHADERATCHQCQSWADHAHDPITNRRITLDEWEGRPDAPDPPGSSSATVDLPPAAEPYRPPATSSSTTLPRSSTAPTAGAAMTTGVSYGGLKARIAGVSSRIPDHQGAVQQALQGINEEINQVVAANEDSDRLSETLGALLAAREKAEECAQMLARAAQEADTAAAGLS